MHVKNWKCSYKIRPFIFNDGTYHSFVDGESLLFFFFFLIWTTFLFFLFAFFSRFCLIEHLRSFSLSLSFLTIIIVQTEWCTMRKWSIINERKKKKEQSVQQSVLTDHILNWNIYWMNRMNIQVFHALICKIMARHLCVLDPFHLYS